MNNVGEKGEGGNSGLMLDCKTPITDPITLDFNGSLQHHCNL